MKDKVTVFIATPDIHSKMFKKCVSAVKKNTENYKLVVFDNNYDSSFNHSSEINKVIKCVDTRYLVLLDDDVVVFENWLKGLLNSLKKTESAVCGCKHIGIEGKITHSGGCVLRDGKTAHYVCNFKNDSYFPYVCSAVMLIDIDAVREKNIFFDNALEKYYNDTDFCLKVWENDLRVCSSADVKVFHYGGGRKGKIDFNDDFDSGYFARKWAVSGRLNDLMRKIDNVLDYGKIDESMKYLNLLNEYSFASMKNDYDMFESIYDNALKIWESGLGLNILFGACFHLGEICYKKKDFKKANFWLKKCLFYNPNHLKAKRLLKKLKNKK